MSQPESLYFIPETDVKENFGDAVPSTTELVGPELLRAAGDFIADDFRLTPEQKADVLDRLGVLQEQARFNVPIMVVNGQRDSPDELTAAGYIGAPLYLRQKHGGNLSLNAAVYQDSFRGTWEPHKVEYDLWAFTSDVVDGAPNRFIVGGDAISSWLHRRGLAIMQPTLPSEFHVWRDVELLLTLSRGDIPVRALGLDEEQRLTAVEGLTADFIRRDMPEAQHIWQQLAAIEYLAGAQTPEHRQQICQTLSDALIPLLPISPQEQDVQSGMSAIVKMLELARIMPEVPGVPASPKIREDAKKAALLHHLYAQRATYEPAANGEPPEPAAGWTDIRRWPPDHTLHMFANPKPEADEVWDDILHLNDLAVRDVPVELLRRNEERMSKATRQILIHLVERTELAQMPQVFNALEYLFDIHRPDQTEQKLELMHLLRNRLALSMPIERWQGQTFITNALLVAQGLSERMSQLTGEPFNPIKMMSDLYGRRANREILRDQNRPDPDEDASNGSVVQHGTYLGRTPDNLRDLV